MKKNNVHTDPKVADLDERIAKLLKRVRKADSKKERKAIEADIEVLVAKRDKRLNKLVTNDEVTPSDSKIEHDPEAVIAAAELVLNDANASPGAIKSAKEAKTRATATLQGGHYDRQEGETEPDYQHRKRAERDTALAAEVKANRETETDEQIKARVAAKRAAREKTTESKAVGDVTIDVDDLPGKKHKDKKKGHDKGASEGTETTATIAESVATEESGAVFVDPEAAQPRDRWDRPLIQPVGGGKAVGYKRTTTFIDVIDDKTNLVNWGRRIVLTGAAAIDQKIGGDDKLVGVDEVGTVSVIERVKAANDALVTAAKAADKALAKGKVDETEHARLHDAAESAHKRTLDELVQEAFRAGDGFTKAETGTRIHKLTEVFDLGGTKALAAMEEPPTKSEYRDIEAYAAACAKLNVEVLDVEQFVVVDDIKVGGTLDRRLRYDSPSLGRRITAIGDVKTGRVDYGMGKMCRQLAIYAKGKGYDWHKPEERVTFRTNQEVGLIFHLPAGSGVCEVWEIDLKKGWEGVQLCAKVWAHRGETTQAKVGTKIATSVEVAE